MNNDVKKWLNNFNNKNKKRNLDNDDLIKELNYYCIQTIIKILKQNKVDNKNNLLFLEGLKFIFTHTNKNYSKNKDKDIVLLINACTTISINKIGFFLYTR